MSFPRYPSYKDSEVVWLGEIPSHWDVKPMKWVTERNDGGVWGNDPTGEGDTVVLRSTEQTVDGRWQLDEPALRSLTETEKAGSLLAIGDLLVTKSSGSALHIGKTTLVTPEVAALGCCYSNFMQRIRLKSDFDSRLAWYLMNNEIARAQFDLLSNSTTGLANLNGTMLGELVAPIPTPDEQAAIVKFLDRETAKIDALVAEQEQLITLLKEKRQAVISHAVTKGLDPSVPMKDSGVEWLGEVPAHWQVNRLQRVVAPGTSVTYGIVQAGPDVEDGIPYIRTSDMSGDALPLAGYPKTSPVIDASYARSKVSAGDLVIAIRATVGKCLPVPQELEGANLTQGTARIAPGSDTDPGYLLALINASSTQTYFDLMAKGATFREITLEVLRKTPVLVPPLYEQRKIAAWAKRQSDQFLALIHEAEQAQGLLKERRSALISAAVTGQIDVRGLFSAKEAA